MGNNILKFDETSALLKDIIALRKAGMSVETVIELIIQSRKILEAKAVLAMAERVRKACTNIKNYNTVEHLISSDLCKILGSEEYFSFNPSTLKRTPVTATSLKAMFNEEYLYANVKHLADVYDPKTPSVFTTKDGTDHLNTYYPADWRVPNFYKRAPLGPVAMPPIYKEFFGHLVDGDPGSLAYVLSWIALSIVDRNYTYMVTIGNQGIGKGMLYQIVALLHGEHNSGSILAEEFFASRFNSGMNRKTFYYIDELEDVDDTKLAKLKILVNEELRIEVKHENAIDVKNNLNIMMSSNNRKALTITEDDRRFSIVTLTQKKLVELWGSKLDDKIAELKDPENIAMLGAHLVTQCMPNVSDMKVPYKSAQQMKEIKNAALEDWVDVFLFNICQTFAGQTKSLVEVQDEIASQMNKTALRPSKGRLIEVKLAYPGFFTETYVKGSDGRQGASGIKFADIKKQPTRAALGLDAASEE